MPTEKRSKEQTWKEDELKQSIREVHGERSSGKARRDKYGDENKVSKESSHRDKYRDKKGEEHRERRKDKSDSERKRSERDERSRNKPDQEEGESRRYRDDRERNGQGRNDDRDDERRSNRRHGRASENSERQRHEMDRERRNKGDNYERDERGNDKSDRREHSRRVEDRGQSKRDDSRSRSHRGGDANDRSHGEGDRSKGPRREDKDRGHQEGGRSKGHRSDDRDRGHKGEDRDREHRDRGHRGEDRDREHKDRGHRGEDRDREHKDRGHRGEDRDKEHRERSHRKDDRDRGSEREEKDRGHRGEEQSRRHKDSDRDRGHRKEKDRETHRDDRDREKKDRERDRHHRDDESVHRRKDGERKRRDHNDSEQLDQSYQDRGIRDGDRRESKRRDRDEIDRNQEKHRERQPRGYDANDVEGPDTGGSFIKRRDRDDRERHNNDTDRDRRPRYSDKKEEERHHDKDDYKKEKKHRDKTGSEQRQEHKQEASNSAEDGNSKGSRKATVNPQKDNEEDEISYKPRGSAKPVAAQEEDDYGGYDDDFEDYDEDFEDDDGDNDDSVAERVNRMSSAAPKPSNSEMEALYDALNAENEKLLADSRSNLSDTPEYQEERYDSRKATSNKPRGFINFVAAKQRDMNQKVASKARKRCTELLNIIELDTVHMTLFDLPPVKEYDLYMSSFGRTNAQQACVQTNEDNLERDTQTEDIDLTTKWTQCPSEGAAACGSADKTTDSSDTSRHDDGKLTAFLQRTCQVIERLLYEEDTKSLYKDTSSEFSCSEASFNLVDVEVFRCRQVSRCYFSPTDSTIILTMHTGPMQAVDRKLDKYGMIGVWNTNDPSAPQKIVASASMPSCCCFSPIKATLVFGGMRDGSLVAWDLREPPTMHHSYICGKTDWLLRFPTYNTAGVLKYDNHSSPITALTPILTDSSKSLSQESGLGLSFQLASLDKNGVVNLWVVAEIHETSMAGSESDLGLSPNGKIKLLKSSTVTLCNPVKNSDLSSLCTVDFKLNPSNHNHFYVGTDSGSIIHGTRFGTKKVSPRCYISDDLTPCKVNSIDLHPFGHPLMLAGCDDGSLKLYHLASESPIIVWENSTGGAAIRRVLWSRNCSYILFVLDNKSTIHMWDLLRNDAEPMTSDSMSRNNLEVTDVCLSEEHAHSRPKMVMSYSNGTVQVHLLSGHVSNLQPGENDQFTRFIDNL